jgi:hypothetical protein
MPTAPPTHAIGCHPAAAGFSRGGEGRLRGIDEVAGGTVLWAGPEVCAEDPDPCVAVELREDDPADELGEDDSVVELGDDCFVVAAATAMVSVCLAIGPEVALLAAGS